jgi:O-antigen/teichoic acid export membrane protein
MVAFGTLTAASLAALLNAVLSAELGPEEYGVYTFIIATAALLGAVARLGLAPIIVRDLALSVDESAPDGTREPILAALGLTGGLAALLALVTISLLGLELLEIAGDLSPTEVGAMAVLFISTAIYTLSTESLRGMHRLPSASLLGLPIHRAVSLGLVLAVVLTFDDRIGVEAAVWMTAGAALTALVAAAGYLAMRIKRMPGRFPERRYVGRMARAGGPVLVAEILSLVSSRLPIWVLAATGAFGDAGVFGLALAFVTFIGLTQQIATGTLAPFVASSYHDGAHEELQSRIRVVAAATSALAALGGIALVAGGSFAVPRLLGSGFDDAVAVSAILLIGTVAGAVAGPCGLLLNLAGGERWTALASLISVLVAVSTVIPAAHLGGAIGAAIAIAASTVVRVVLAFRFARRITGISTAADFRGLYRLVRKPPV